MSNQSEMCFLTIQVPKKTFEILEKLTRAHGKASKSDFIDFLVNLADTVEQTTDDLMVASIYQGANVGCDFDLNDLDIIFCDAHIKRFCD